MSSSLGVSIVTSLLAVCGHSQQFLPPPIEWQQAYGGGQNDYLYALRETQDGGYLLGGSSESPAGGTKTSTNCAATDYWIVRLDASGNSVWDVTFGGTSFDNLRSIGETADGGIIVGGSSQSGISCSKLTPYYGTQSGDYWVLRLDRNGNKTWEQDIGGNYSDLLWQVQQTADGAFFLAGYSGSPPSGNKTAIPQGGEDYWAVRLNTNGAILWDRSFGGEANDYLRDGQQTDEGGFILGGGSLSQPSGNKSSPNYGSTNRFTATADFWIVRLDANGNKLWDRSFGGIYDDTLYCMRQMPDGGYMLAGRSSSPPGGNKTSPNYGGADFWLVRLDASGNKLREQSFGGTGDEYPYSMAVTTDGGVIVGGWSNSGISGNKTAPSFGGADFWVVRLDADGNKLWEAGYGGSRADQLQSLQQTRDGGFILGGGSHSPADGNKTVPTDFWSDFWVIKLGPEQPRLGFLDPPFEAGGARLSLTGIKNVSYTIDCSTNLEAWTPWQTNRLSGPTIELLDSAATNAAQRFYRARRVQ